MELRLLVIGSDPGVREMLRAQAQNIGCDCNAARDFSEVRGVLGWAQAAIVDLADGGLEALEHLRVEAPDLPVLAVATDDAQAAAARDAGATVVLTEPYPIPELVAAIRQLQPAGSAQVVDLREAAAAKVADDAPWWATR